MATHENGTAVGGEGGPPAHRWRPSLGAWPEEGGTRFRVWAPGAESLEVVLRRADGTEGVTALAKAPDGTFSGLVTGAGGGDRYVYRVDGRETFPDPATRSQPEGVHGPSEVIDPARFAWTDSGWRGVEPEEVVVYELHVGTFTPEGTFAAAVTRLPHLRDLGVTAVELMPVADFAGKRSWGYDGVDLFAPALAYGRPDDLRRFVDEAHRLGLAVILDVVYNHFGPVGNYTLSFSPHYLSATHSSPWGAGVNLDGEGARQVRDFFIENACHWVHEYHVDGLRLDATHALVDDSPVPFVAELAERVRSTVSGRRVLIVAEDERNLRDLILPRADGGWGLDGVWADDLHHQLRRQIAGDNEGYYRDYTGSVEDLARTINDGWFYRGEHSAHLGGPRGTNPSGLPARSFVVCLQNHDQVGNRAFGDRLTAKVGLDAYRAASALLLTLPETPLLFMGQEWAASSPFQYFTDHEPELGKVVTEGRRREFQGFTAFHDPEARALIPDPQAAATFEASRLDWSEPDQEPHAAVLRLYRELLRLRRHDPALRPHAEGSHAAFPIDDVSLALRREAPGAPTLWVVARFHGAGTVDLAPLVDTDNGDWETVLTTEDPTFAPDPQPPHVGKDGPAPSILFGRPGAVLLRWRPVGAEGLKG